MNANGTDWFEALFRRAPFGVAIADPQGRFVQVNDRFCDMLGYTQDEASRLVAAVRTLLAEGDP